MRGTIKASEFFDLLEKKPLKKKEITPALNERVDHLKEITTPKLDLTTASELLKTFDLVDERIGYEEENIESFYRGNKPSWGIIRKEGDAQRTFYEKIFEDVLLDDELEKIETTEVVLITAEAGAGKSTLLMRLAYDHACLFEGLCLFHKQFREVPFFAIEELYRVTKKRLFIYMDDVADDINILRFLVGRSKALNIPITIVCAERKNEWNSIKDRLSQVIPIEYELPYLDEHEIENILNVLEKNNYLCELENKLPEERKEIFKQKAHKQLLVAMREATEGDDFDEIIKNEFDGIPSELGKQTYLHVCSLHRLGVSVRAGLIQRLSGVSFGDFKEKLLEPCERVIIVEYDEALDTHLYRARHPHIAEVVCKYALNNADKISETYLQVLAKMDLGYSSDLYSFRELVRANHIINTMPNIQHRRLFFDTALKLSGNNAYVYQQYGIMEMRYENITEAETYLSSACRLDRQNLAYKHSYSRLLFRKSEQASNSVLKNRLFTEAQKILLGIMRIWTRNPYAYDGYAQNLIIRSGEYDGKRKEELLKEAHLVIQDGLRFCHDRAYLQATEAKIFQKLGEYEKAKQSLLDSHNNDPSSVRTALFLGHLLKRNGETNLAYSVVSKARKYNEDHPALNVLAAKLALIETPDDHGKIIDFLKKSFDDSYIDKYANFLLGVEYFRNNEFEKSEEIFSNFRRRKIFWRENSSYYVKEHMKDKDGELLEYEGYVKTVFGNKGFINPDLLPKDIFFMRQNVKGGEVSINKRVKFKIGFNLFGATAQYGTLKR